MQRRIVSISLSPKIYRTLEKLQRKEDKSRSELIRSLIKRYEKEKDLGADF